MSLRNRARSLQKKTGLSYQQALAKLRALGEKPARLSKQTGWTLAGCDRFLVDGHAPIHVIDVFGTRIPTLHELIEQVCETLRATTSARAVVCVARSGRVLAHVGGDDFELVLRGALLRKAPPEGIKEIARKW